MIIMGPRKDRGSAIAHIMDKLSENSHDKLKHENEQMSHSGMRDETRHESLDAAANEIMEALKANDVSKMQNSLKSFIQICMKKQHEME